jgi:hypothetical protein
MKLTRTFNLISPLRAMLSADKIAKQTTIYEEPNHKIAFVNEKVIAASQTMFFALNEKTEM